MNDKLRLLLLEDSPDDADLLVLRLEEAGFAPDWKRVQTERDFLAALAESPDLILADYHLPGFKGTDALRLLNERGLDIPFILVSGTVGEDIAVNAMRSGASDYLMKDRPARLGEAARHALEQKELREAKRRSEQALRESEQNYRVLMEDAADAIFISNHEGALVDVNEAACALLGYTRAEFLGMTYRDLVAPEDFAARPPHMQELHAGKTISSERSLVRKDGARVPVEIRSKMLEDGRLQGIARDITERRQAEEALHQSEAMYRDLFENMHDGVYRNTPQGKITTANSALVRMLGYDSEADLKQVSITDTYVHASDREFFIKRIAEANDALDLELRLKRKDGSQIVVLDHVHVVRDEAGNILYYEGTLTDITERKRAEEGVRESEARYRELFESNPHPMWVYDLETLGFLAVNDAAVLHYGYSRDEFRAMTIKDIRPPEDVPRLLQNIARVKDGSDEAGVWRHVKKNGEIIEVEIASHALTFGERRAEMVLANDVTERRRAGMETIRRNEDLSLLDSFNQALNRGEDLHSVVERVSNGLKRVFQTHGATIYLLDDKRAHLVNLNMALPLDLQHKIEKLLGFTLPRIEIDLQSNHPFRRVFETGKVEMFSDEERIKEHYLAFAGAMTLNPVMSAAARKVLPLVPKIVGINSEILAPLVANNEIIGVIDMGSRVPLTEEDARRMEHIAGQLTAAIRRAQAEESLRSSEERYRDLVENIHELICTHDLEGNLLSANRAATSLLGYVREEMIGRNLRDFLAPEVRHHFDTYLSLVQKRGGASGLMNVQTKNGETRVWEYHNTLRTEGVAAPIVRGYAHDVTEQRRAQGALRESEARYRGIFDGVQEAIFVETPAGDILDVNESACRMFGWTRAEFMTKKVSDLVPADRAALALDENGQVELSENFIETVNLRADGSDFPVEVSGRRHTLGGKPALLVVVRDISERKRAEKQVERRIVELEALYQSGIAFSQSLNPQEIGEKLIEVLVGRLEWHHAAVRMRRGQGREVELLAFSQANEEENAAVLQSAITEVGQGMAGWVIEHGQAARTSDLENDPRYKTTYAGMKSGLYVPIKIQNVTLGCISAESEMENAFTREDELLMTTIALQAGVAFENARLYGKALLAGRRLTALYEAGQQMARVTEDIEELYAAAHRAATQLMPAEVFTIVFHNEAANTLDGAYLFDKGGRWHVPPAPIGEGFSSRVILSGRAVLNNDLLETPLQAVHFGTGERVRSVLAVPLRSGDKVIGAISAQSYSPNAYTEDDRFLFEMLAAEAAVAFENTRLFQSLEHELGERKRDEEQILRQLAHIAVLREIDQIIASSFDLEFSLKSILAKSAEILHVDAAAILLVNPANNTLEYAAGQGFRTPAPEFASVKVGESYAGRAVLERKPVRIPDLAKDPENEFLTGFLKGEGFVSYHCVPLIVKGQALGVMEVFHRSFVERDEEWSGFLEALAGQSAIAVDNAQLFDASRRELAERKLAEEKLRALNAGLEKRIEERTADLRQSNYELERALRIKDEFLANMSHELRTPLNAIIGLSESLAEQTAGALNEKQEKYVGTIGESGQHLLNLINDILDLAKIESGQVTLEREKVNISDVCQSSLRMVRQLALNKNQDLQFEMDADLGKIWADDRRLKQMIVNLLSNAVKFTPDFGKLGLRARGDRENNTIRFTVWDTGIGIREDDLPRLFQPFVQLDSRLARTSDGTGLGLALVAKMASLHGGSVSVESQLGIGSQFTIILPWESALTTGTLSAPAAHEPKTQPVNPQERVILVVDDTEDVILLFKDYLEHAGFTVAVARNGKEGIIQAQAVNPDLILMDAQMPVMDGLEATREIRKIPAFAHTPIIALTALAMKGDRDRCIEAGMNDYLSKPVVLRSLVELIEKHLSDRAEDTRS